MVEITNMSNQSLSSSIYNASAPPACTCKKPAQPSGRRWARLSWPWQPAAPSSPPAAAAAAAAMCAVHSPMSSPAVSIRTRSGLSLADFLLPSEAARMRTLEPPLPECDPEDERYYSGYEENDVVDEDVMEMEAEQGDSSWPDMREHVNNNNSSIREWVAGIPKEAPVLLTDFALAAADAPGSSRRSCAIAPETAGSDFTTTDATANDEYRHAPWPDHESAESSMADELSVIESFGEDLLVEQQPDYNTSFGIRICPDNVLGLVSNLLERGALDDSYLADDTMGSLERSQRDSSFEHNLHTHTHPGHHDASDRHSDVLTWQEAHPSSITPEHAYCT
ncbi:hypothetical protein SYNPS1DRAFT_31778 [Syncephalis pseudoplumigaleata]|uniref:Uncharacterized protein n=1 Tax=Syncephalis pseudoplumigaleata TaxID=1712513 RepID=A0A4P9YRY7_9FUNG|nr:hypothetical protein SYNPS1DRAFT_31778 [Syncephalis pseudoplumigaleata]|eukprot:RKP22617.1 hypothetical protein SYNPS1DRAFT_31778 [Syncephalis pseudoplumigaleata]